VTSRDNIAGVWQRRIDRATELAAQDEAIRPLLVFYAQLLGLQRDAYDALRRHDAGLSGSLARDLGIVRRSATPMLTGLAALAPPLLADDARQMLDGGDAVIDGMLIEWWQSPSDQQFFPKVILQPYAQRLAELGVRPADRDRPAHDLVCPFCGGAPQVSTLHGGGELEGGGRSLLCATCITPWPFRRVRCASCGEEDERRLAYYHAPSMDHLRVDACETCRRYIKTVDLTRLGIAVPLVDEVAGAPLDVWARERGYQKIELNLVGL
jgi:FdhE protein